MTSDEKKVSAEPKLERIPVAKIVESSWNPRKTYDPAEQKNLETSIATHGQLVPGTLRPIAGGKYELAAGSRRFRAVRKIGLETYLAIVRDMTDAQFCEVLTVDNDERADVHPLEQANGFRLIMEHAGYDVAKIAARISRSHDFVYDRLSLLELNPELKALFLDNRFGLAQAIILAKLAPDEQRKAAKIPTRYDDHDSGLWRSSGPTLDDEIFPHVAKTAAELERWITTHLRFDERTVQVEELFPETAAAIDAATEAGVRVVGVTYDEYMPQSIERTEDKIFTSKFWKRADGLEGSRVCDYAVVGVVRAGDGRGASLGVCVSRDTCRVHFASRVKDLEARKKEKKAGAPTTPAAKAKRDRKEAARAKREAAANLQENVTKSKTIAAATLIQASLDAIVRKAAPAIVKHARAILGGKDRDGLSLEQLVVKLAIDENIRDDLVYALNSTWSRAKTIKSLKEWGVNAPKVIAGVKVETCVYCGCSEENACRLGQFGGGPSCKWVSTEPRVCSNPTCVAAYKAKTTGAKVETPAAAKAEVLNDIDQGDDD
jgi:ParB/RepB/Spo0J family partition protein